MDPDPVERLLTSASKRLERARLMEIGLRAGFHQLTITNSSVRHIDLIKTFSSPLPDVQAVGCQNCARYELRLAEFQAKLDELEQGRANNCEEVPNPEAPPNK